MNESITVLSKNVSEMIFQDYNGSNPEISSSEVLSKIYSENIGIPVIYVEE